MSAHVMDRLSAYLDGALGADELGRVEAHLETCGGCLREYQELRSLQQLLRGLPEPSAAEGFGERLHWRLQREAARPAARSWVSWLRARPLRFALACATVLMILALPAGQMMTRETPLDADAYLREYLILSVDQPFGDETGATIATSVPPSLESPRR
ncbi:MAG TPA: zf-HC2 domain-containing protein [bacterium]|nr:zf-HC2 domain-containing protein [bacterium]